ncbi:MAG: CocE/NonD family hydrolase [Gammaproteobacteria bacterium]|nr:CocE/NonD family hydrolase [Gammaproteobacteria bacterium]
MNPADSSAPLMRAGSDPHSAPGKPPLPPPQHTLRVAYGLEIETNVAIPLRDGTRIYADVYRPRAVNRDLPVLLSWSPYGKHARSNRVFWPHSGVDPAWLSELTPFEGPDPVYWGARGIAVAVVDPRGAWLSEGDFHHHGRQEAEDCHDAIQWLAQCPWSNGRVGMTGVSYLAVVQYLAASLRPPALAAINPWEGFSDFYREFALHGGIPETGFLPRAAQSTRYSLHHVEDTLANVQAHPLFDDFWRSKEMDLEAIVVPAYVVASWSDQGLHLRGTLEAYRRMRSRDKWLEVHGQKKWAHYYRPESRQRRAEFFGHYLQQRHTALPAWPRVRLEVRERAGVAVERTATHWPLPQTRHRPLWLDAAHGTLGTERPGDSAHLGYAAASGHACFDLRFEADRELTGYMKLRLWVEAEGADDMDLFVALQKLDAQSRPVGFTFYAFHDDGPVALGWLRASHRALDAARSTDWQPVHTHTRAEPLPHGRPVPLDIEIWPSATLFRAGETLRVIVQGSDVYSESPPQLPFARHTVLCNAGRHLIHTGGQYDSHLLVPWLEPLAYSGTR